MLAFELRAQAAGTALCWSVLGAPELSRSHLGETTSYSLGSTHPAYGQGSAFTGELQLDRSGETSAQYDFPRRLANVSFTYNNGPLTFNLQTRYRSETVRDVTWVEGRDIEDNSVGSRAYTNMNFAYNFDWSDNSAQVYLYVGNLFDKDPPPTPYIILNGPVNGQYYDKVGRNFVAGVRVKL